MSTISAGTGLGPSEFIKIILIGIIGTTLYTYAIIPNVESYFNIYILSNIAFDDKIFVWAILGLVFGILLSSLDKYIYQFYEGIWPRKLWDFKSTELDCTFGREFTYIDKKLLDLMNEREEERKKNNAGDINKIENLTRNIAVLSQKIRDYPYDPEEKYNFRRRSERCTKLGNIIADYETYSNKKYGLNMEIISPHMWLILPEDVKKDLDLRGSIADFPVYVSFIFLTYSFIGAVGYYFQAGFMVAISVCIISLFLSYILYRFSIIFHRDYGKYIKAMFDLYRSELGEKLNLEVSNYPTDREIEEWRENQSYIYVHKKPERNKRRKYKRK